MNCSEEGGGKKIRPVTNCRQLSAYHKHGDALVPIMRRDRMAAQQKGGGYQGSLMQVSTPERSRTVSPIPRTPEVDCSGFTEPEVVMQRRARTRPLGWRRRSVMAVDCGERRAGIPQIILMPRPEKVITRKLLFS